MDPAKHAWIAELLNGSFTESADAPSTITLQTGERLGRIRLYGITVSTDPLVIDDGTGSTTIRTFSAPATLSIGDPVLIIGKPRKHNNALYLVGDIIKPVDTAWLTLASKQRPRPQQQKDVLATVRTLDTGDGANYEDVVSTLGAKGEERVAHHLANGDLFETRPGKLKVLE